MNRYEATIALWGIFALLAALTIIFAGANVVALGVLGVAAIISTLAVNDEPSESKKPPKSKSPKTKTAIRSMR